MAKGINIDDFSGLSSSKKKKLNSSLKEQGFSSVDEAYDFIMNALKGESNGGFGGIGGRGDNFSDVFSMRETNKEASRLLEVLKEIKEHGRSGVANRKDLEILMKMGLNFKDIENSSKEVEKNLKNAKFDNNFGNRLVEYNRLVKGIGNSLSDMYDKIEDIVEPWAKANDAASKYAKNVAMSAAGMKAMTNRTINNVVHSKIGISFNMSSEELIQAQQKYVEGVGRSLSIDNTQQESLAAMTAVMGDRSIELAAAFENFGVNLNTTAERSGKMFDKASKTGISFEKLTDNVAKNIKIAQNYTFKNGLKGLESMAAKAVALRMDMSQVAALADKVSSVEGSIDVASKLQVLGGPFASMADPLGMLNEGLTDMEGLMDRVTKMVGGMGTFDKATGEVKVSAFNKKRIQAAAEAMGVSYDTLMESATAQAKRGEVARQISSSASAKNLSDDMKELIKNSATFDKNGKAGVNIDGDFKSIDDLKEEDYKTLIKETQSESDDIKDIAKMLRSHFDYTEGIGKQKDAVQAKIVGPIGQGLNKIIGWVGKINGLLGTIVAIQLAGKAINMLSSGFDIFKTFKGGKGGVIKNFISGKAPKASSKIAGLAKSGGILKTNSGNEFEVVGGKIINKATGKTVYGNAAKKVLESAENTMGKDTVANIIKQSNKTAENTINVSQKMANNASKSGKLVRNIGKPLRKVKQIKNLVKAGKGAKVLSSVAKGAGKKIPIVGGLISAGLTAFEDKDKFKDKATRGHAIGKTAGAGVGAVLGGAVGTLLGPLGSIAGAAVGEWVGKHVGGFIGGIQDKRVTKNRAIVDNQLKEYGIERKGDYSVRNLKKINKALQTGELSDKMRKKLLEQGDTDLVKQIDAKKYEIEEKNEAKKDRKAQRNRLINRENGEKADKIIKSANFIVGNAYFGGKVFDTLGGGFDNKFGAKLPSLELSPKLSNLSFGKFIENNENENKGERNGGRIFKNLYTKHTDKSGAIIEKGDIGKENKEDELSKKFSGYLLVKNAIVENVQINKGKDGKKGIEIAAKNINENTEGGIKDNVKEKNLLQNGNATGQSLSGTDFGGIYSKTTVAKPNVSSENEKTSNRKVSLKTNFKNVVIGASIGNIIPGIGPVIGASIGGLIGGVRSRRTNKEEKSVEIKAKPENGESVEAKEMQKKAEVKASNEKKREEEKRRTEEEQRNKVFNGGKIDVNITGTIKLEANGKHFNMNELMNDSGFKQELAKFISEQIKYNNTQSNIVERK